MYLFAEGHLTDFSANELIALIRALFSDTPVRAKKHRDHQAISETAHLSCIEIQRNDNKSSVAIHRFGLQGKQDVVIHRGLRIHRLKHCNIHDIDGGCPRALGQHEVVTQLGRKAEMRMWNENYAGRGRWIGNFDIRSRPAGRDKQGDEFEFSACIEFKA